MGTERGENCKTTAVDSLLATNNLDFITQMVAAFAKRLPANVDVDSFAEKITDAYLNSPPPAEI